MRSYAVQNSKNDAVDASVMLSLCQQIMQRAQTTDKPIFVEGARSALHQVQL